MGSTLKHEAGWIIWKAIVDGSWMLLISHDYEGY